MLLVSFLEAFSPFWPPKKRFGPFAEIPSLALVRCGKLHGLAMRRGGGSTTLAKIFLRIVDAPARLKLEGEHVEQFEQDFVTHCSTRYMWLL